MRRGAWASEGLSEPDEPAGTDEVRDQETGEGAYDEDTYDESAYDESAYDDAAAENGSATEGPGPSKIDRRLSEVNDKLAAAAPEARPEMIATLYGYIDSWPESARRCAEEMIAPKR